MMRCLLSAQRLLKPVVRERLVVEGGHFDPASGPVEGERLDEDRAGLDVRDPGSASPARTPPVAPTDDGPIRVLGHSERATCA